MQEDFHFYTIYALCRAAGFSPDSAHIVAYSSQHTDDAKYGHALNFENGGRFQQVLTAHRYIDINVFSKEVCYNIWIPFHFLPGNLGVDFYERLFVSPNSVISQRMIEDFLDSEIKPYTLHRLGIILHVYADTWSHQNFMGIMKDYNDVKELKVMDEDENFLKGLLEDLKDKILEYALPMLGHTQAGTIPDEPYRVWEYRDFRDEFHRVINRVRALDAAQNCYMLLLRFLRRFPQFCYSNPLSWQDMVSKIDELFSKKGDLEDRIQIWKKAIREGQLGFKVEKDDEYINYNDRDWFKAAVRVIEEEETIHYERLEGFEISNWKYFHDAAAFHKFHILHEVLPDYGIICG